MRNWAFLAKIVGSKEREKGLAVKFTAGSFFVNYDKEKLSHKTVYVVPPVIDAPRAFLVEDIKQLNAPKNTGFISVLPVKYDICNHDKLSNVQVNTCIQSSIHKSDASRLEGHFLLIEKDDLQAAATKDMLLDDDLDELLGCKVVDVNAGILGCISFVGGTQAQRLLYVKPQTANSKDKDADNLEAADKPKDDIIMIPYVAEFIREVGKSSIVVDLPKGLLELNTKE